MFLNLFSKPKVKVHGGKINPTVLLVLDGWGIAPPSEGNAIALAKPKNYNEFLANYPHAELLAAGESVGLPANEVGNTEVGHLNMGAGRVILQDLKRIDKSIEDGSFFENKSFYRALFHAQKNKSKLHLVGLLSSGQVHSSAKHLYALLEFLKRNNAQNVFLHLFTDGRDAPPEEAASVFEKLESYLKANKIGQVATVGGRYYGMDRDKRWERTQKAYDAMVKGIGPVALTSVEAIKQNYAKKITDEFIEPTVISKNGLISNNDAVIFFNYRIDRPRQITMSIVVKDFEGTNISWEFDPYSVKYEKKHEENTANIITKEPFPRGNPPLNLYSVTMTQYQKNLPVNEVAFPPEEVIDCLTEVLSKKQIAQMHMSESEKERFVTYYFDGLREERMAGEDVKIIPSPHVPTYDKRPQMSVAELAEEFKKVLNEDKYNFIIMNIANPDMVAHSGKIPETIKAIGAVDLALGEIVGGVLTCNGTILITGDHGNAEEMITYPSSSYFFTSKAGTMNTDHSSNPVPIIIINNSLKNSNKPIPNGKLADIAPTILKLMGIEIPPVMTGKNLLG
ncbi:2,3-bisphosphoglycerate-independent phosphoglycerate mutase [soil metagenome]